MLDISCESSARHSLHEMSSLIFSEKKKKLFPNALVVIGALVLISIFRSLQYIMRFYNAGIFNRTISRLHSFL